MNNYIFGYGSIINDESRSSTLALSAPQPGSADCGNGTGDSAVCAFLSHKFARRHWNYRCSTGFTALGLQLGEECKSETVEIISKSKPTVSPTLYDGVNGVLYPVFGEQLKSFDTREIGYDRVLVPLDMIQISAVYGSPAARTRAEELQHSLQAKDTAISIWVYVPCPSHSALPDEDYPILQTYVDVCVRGCLQWGGQPMAHHFLITTHNWSDCFLNDTPLSRRPWLHRLDYAAVDSCLSGFADHVKLECRRHPEEFARLHGSALKPGLWGVEPRNNHFVGRDAFLAALHCRLYGRGNGRSEEDDNAVVPFASTESGISDIRCRGGLRQVEVVGMGGVGKSQVSIEYAHRHYGSSYGFVAFIRAESTASIAADLRRLAHDMGILPVLPTRRPTDIENKSDDIACPSHRSQESGSVKIIREEDMPLDDETIAEEIKRRLARSRFRWLLIFDNVEDSESVAHYLPRGLESSRFGGGHVLVTSRIAHAVWVARDSAMVLDCFGAEESVRFLNMALKLRSRSVDSTAVGADGSMLEGTPQATSTGEVSQDEGLAALACRMGHLPLALWTAGVYMRRCDVSSTEYIRRFDSIITRSIQTGHESGEAISACFLMTVDKISHEVDSASEILLCIGFLAPDISKSMLKLLLCGRHFNSLAHSNRSISSAGAAFIERNELAPVHSAQHDINLYRDYSLEKNSWLFDHMMCSLMVCGMVMCLVGKSVFNVSAITKRDVDVFVFGLMLGCVFSCTLTMIVLHRNNFHQCHPPEHAPRDTSPSCREPAASTMSGEDMLPTSLSECQSILTSQELIDEADKLWDLMRQFSLLSSLRGPFDDDRIGTVHRLQQAVLRSRATTGSSVESNSPISAVDCMERCIWLLHTMWGFDVSDVLSWDSAGDVLEHIETLARHVLNNIYASEQRSQRSETCSDISKVSQKYALQFASLLTSGGEYASIVLSRFDTAQQLLETACSLHVYILHPHALKDQTERISFEDIDVSSIDADICEVDKLSCLDSIGNTLHMLGKTLRYNGLLSQSENCLKRALRIRKCICAENELDHNSEAPQFVEGTASHSISISIKVSETMYELGVLFLRMHSLYAAKSHLTLALELICGLKFTYGPDTTHQVVNLSFQRRVQSREAAALHQLGVIATLERRYEDAEGHLLAALSVMTTHIDSEGRISIARAATLQQLGKVELRRGNLTTARQHLSSALDIYRAVYGEHRSASHINVAAVLNHLGSTAVASKQYESACEYFSDALAAREKIAEESSSGSIDVILAVKSLAQAEMECGRWDAAEGLFLRAKREAERELGVLREPGCVGAARVTDASLSAPTCKDSSSAFTSTRQSLVKTLFFCVHSLKGIYTKKKRADLAAQMTKEVRALKLTHRNDTDKRPKKNKEDNSSTRSTNGNDEVLEVAPSSTADKQLIDVKAPVRVLCESNSPLDDASINVLSCVLCYRHEVRKECRSIQKLLGQCSSLTDCDNCINTYDADCIRICCGRLIVAGNTAMQVDSGICDSCDVNDTLSTLKERRCHFISRVNSVLSTIEECVLCESANTAEFDSLLSATNITTYCKEIFDSCDELRRGLKDIGIDVDDVK